VLLQVVIIEKYLALIDVSPNSKFGYFEELQQKLK
jgi:hypothetical protein